MKKIRTSMAAGAVGLAVALTGAGGLLAAMAATASAAPDNCSYWQTQVDDLQAALDAGTTGFPLPLGLGYHPGNANFGWLDRIIDNAEISFYERLMSAADCSTSSSPTTGPTDTSSGQGSDQ